MSRKQSPTRKELHRATENASRERTQTRRTARRDKTQAHYRFGTENVK